MNGRDAARDQVGVVWNVLPQSGAGGGGVVLERGTTCTIQWNIAGATNRVALVDGSAGEFKLADVIADTAVSTTDPNTLKPPSGTWNPGEAEMSNSLEYGQREGFTWTYNQPAYFFATRDGIRGRDFLRR